MRAVTAVNIGRAIVAARVGDVGGKIRGDGIAFDPGHAARKIGVDGLRVAGVQPGVADSHAFALTAQAQTGD